MMSQPNVGVEPRVTATSHPKVITWNQMLKVTKKDPEYVAVAKVVSNGGEGHWSAGTMGIKKFKENLSAINGMVILTGFSVVSLDLRKHVLEYIHSEHQGVMSME